MSNDQTRPVTLNARHGRGLGVNLFDTAQGYGSIVADAVPMSGPHPEMMPE